MSDTEWDVVIAAYTIQDRAKQDFDRLVKLVSAIKKSVAQVDGHGAKQLKAALEEAAQGEPTGHNEPVW
jgi:hypothetical protein